MRWSDLPLGAKLFRLAHIAYSIVGLASFGYLWACALSGRRDRWLAATIAFLLAEGVALFVGRGNCPFGPLQRRLGDPRPVFELVLPPRAAKAAIPVLFGASLGGIALVVLRPGNPGRQRRRPDSDRNGGPARS